MGVLTARVLCVFSMLAWIGPAIGADLLKNPGQPSAGTVHTSPGMIDQLQQVPADGPQARVAVYRFTDRTAKGKGGYRGW